MKISILTLFPEMFDGPFHHSIIKRASDKKIVEIEFIDIRDFGIGRHKMVDDTPYGGGVGMVMRVDVVKKAIDSVANHKKGEKVILLDPTGITFTQAKAKDFAKFSHLILICGHYEGIDDRIKEFVDERLSIGDYVLTGGELPAMVVVDSVVRLLPGVLGKDKSSENESFEKNLLEYPQYTRPYKFKGKKVPTVLLSGNHKEIDKFRENEAWKRTKKIRPDLLKRG